MSIVKHYFEKVEEAKDLITAFEPGDVVLVKASRAEHFEELASAVVSKISDLTSQEIENEGEIK